MTDDVIHSTQYYIMYINRTIFANLQRRPLKLGRLRDHSLFIRGGGGRGDWVINSKKTPFLSRLPSIKQKKF